VLVKPPGVNSPQQMKSVAPYRTLRVLAIILFIFWWSASPLFAQLLPPLPPEPTDSLIDDILPPILPPLLLDQPLIPLRPITIPQVPVLSQISGPVAPERPASPDRPVLPVTVKDLVKDFQATRQGFLEGQRELLRQLKSAKQEERAIIRGQLNGRLKEWRVLQKSHLR
jgi:hypothetical protein